MTNGLVNPPAAMTSAHSSSWVPPISEKTATPRVCGSASKSGRRSAIDVPSTGSVPVWTAVLTPRPARRSTHGIVPDWPPLRENTPIGPGVKKLLAHSRLPPSHPTTA
jgi:hypothetical protein